LNGLAQVGCVDVGGGLEVGDGAGDFEDAVVGAGAEVEFVHGHAQEFDGFVVDFAMGLEQLGGHPRVATDTGAFCKPFLLNATGCNHPFADVAGGLAGMRAGEVFELDGGHFHMDVDAVEKRSGDALPVSLDLNGRTAALPF